MLVYVNRDITTVSKGIIAHGCNTQGVMGSGVALFLKNKYPQIFPRYREICEDATETQTNEQLLGDVNFVVVAPNLIVANCFTQHLYGYDKGKYARPQAIEDSLATTYAMASIFELDLYIPKIGAGRGGLNWNTDVEPIVKHLSTLDDKIHTYVCTWAE